MIYIRRRQTRIESTGTKGEDSTVKEEGFVLWR
jgi:hypothetical protein